MKLCPWCIKNNDDNAIFCAKCGKSMAVNNEPHQLPVGTMLYDRYYIGAVLRQGGFGITYIGCDTRLDKKVAIKEYYPSDFVNRVTEHSIKVTISAGDKKNLYEKELMRFNEEAKTLAKFAGEKNIVNVTDWFNENDTAYMVMEYVDGKDLDEILASREKMSFAEVYRLLRPIIQTLGRVHGEGLLHRDISPANIKVLPDGTPILLDFGAARQFGGLSEYSYSVVLKPGYAPPEQYDPHGKQGAWTDVYAMCATIYRAITGIVPQNSFTRTGTDTLKMPSSEGAVITPPEELVLMKGLSVSIENRIRTMEELDRAFLAAGNYEKTEIFDDFGNESKSENKSDSKKAPGKKPLYIIAGGICVAALVAIGVFVGSFSDGISSEDVVENQLQLGEMQNTAELVTGSEVILVGDTTNIKYKSGGIEFSKLDDIKYYVDDEKIAVIKEDVDNQQILVEGISAGAATITGVKGNEYGQAQIIVGNLDKSWNLNMKCDINELLLYSDAGDGVSFQVVLEGDLPQKVTANVYNSEGLDLDIGGSFTDRVLSLTVKDVASRKTSGKFTILISDGDNPQHVIGAYEMPINLVF